MANEAHDPWALLREAREVVYQHSLEMQCVAPNHKPVDCSCRAVNPCRNLLVRIDAALAAHEAEERVEVKWRPIGIFGDVDEYVATIGQVNMTIYAEPVSSTGDLLWEVRHTYAASGTAPKLDEAKSAAIAAARGMR